MDAALWGLIGVLLGGVVTGWFTVGATRLQAEADARLDLAKRGNDRQIERDRIQRDTLLELQPALTEWMRADYLLLRADRQNVRATGKLGRLPEGLQQDEMAAGRRFMYLTERVKDDRLRAALNELKSKSAERVALDAATGIVPTEAELMDFELEQTFRARDAQSLLGEVLRAYL